MLLVILLCLLPHSQAAIVKITGPGACALVDAFPNATVSILAESSDRMQEIAARHPEWKILSGSEFNDMSLVTLMAIAIAGALFLLGFFIFACVETPEDRKQLNYPL